MATGASKVKQDVVNDGARNARQTTVTARFDKAKPSGRVLSGISITNRDFQGDRLDAIFKAALGKDYNASITRRPVIFLVGGYLQRLAHLAYNPDMPEPEALFLGYYDLLKWFVRNREVLAQLLTGPGQKALNKLLQPGPHEDDGTTGTQPRLGVQLDQVPTDAAPYVYFNQGTTLDPKAVCTKIKDLINETVKTTVTGESASEFRLWTDTVRGLLPKIEKIETYFELGKAFANNTQQSSEKQAQNHVIKNFAQYELSTAPTIDDFQDRRSAATSAHSQALRDLRTYKVLYHELISDAASFIHSHQAMFPLIQFSTRNYKESEIYLKTVRRQIQYHLEDYVGLIMEGGAKDISGFAYPQTEPSQAFRIMEKLLKNEQKIAYYHIKITERQAKAKKAKSPSSVAPKSSHFGKPKGAAAASPTTATTTQIAPVRQPQPASPDSTPPDDDIEAMLFLLQGAKEGNLRKAAAFSAVHKLSSGKTSLPTPRRSESPPSETSLSPQSPRHGADSDDAASYNTGWAGSHEKDRRASFPPRGPNPQAKLAKPDATSQEHDEARLVGHYGSGSTTSFG